MRKSNIDESILSQWFTGDYTIRSMNDELEAAVQHRVKWPSNVLTVKELRAKLPAASLKWLDEGGDMKSNPVQYEHFLANLVAGQMAGEQRAGSAIVGMKAHLTALYCQWHLIIEETAAGKKAKAREKVNELVADIQNVVHEVTGLPVPQPTVHKVRPKAALEARK
jgi:hypothetical protein